ncbi:TPA: lysozyme inhibitor LprI family protein [Citrobacter freundii]|uniref:lysozyme inhibitor LprI family protein n=1 Tax=Citrobacter freundii TaxID=546 RepID=UPI001EEFA03E|nr:lysozyme inhibitor LprI family protein [Citrobacter freundii]
MRLKYSALLLAVAITGCDNKKDVIGCSSEMTQSALMDLLKKSAYEGLSEQVDKYPDVTNQTKRSALDKIKLTISEISTTSSDTGSTMKTCEGTVTMTLPANEYAQLSDAYRKNFNRNLDKQMESLSLDNNANAFSKRISYTAQATDDQKNVFVKASSDNPISVGAAALTSLSIINPIVEQQKIQQAKDAQQSQIEAEQQAQLRAQQQAKYEAEQQVQQTIQQQSYQQPQQQKADNLDQSRIAFANADSDLNTAWSTLTPAKKKELLPSQRQWIKTKDAMCGKVSMQGTDAEVKKMVDCQTQMTLSRTAFFRNQ